MSEVIGRLLMGDVSIVVSVVVFLMRWRDDSVSRSHMVSGECM